MTEHLSSEYYLEISKELDKMYAEYVGFLEVFDKDDDLTALRQIDHPDSDNIKPDPVVQEFLASRSGCLKQGETYLDFPPTIRTHELNKDIQIHERVLSRVENKKGEIRATVFSSIIIHGDSATEIISIIPGRPKFENPIEHESRPEKDEF